MKVCRFEKIKNENEIVKIINCILNERPYVVVLPVLETIQEQLKKISFNYFRYEDDTWHTVIGELTDYCCTLTDRLIKNPLWNRETKALIHKSTNRIQEWTQEKTDLLVDKRIKAEGYRLSCNLLIYCLRERGFNAQILDTGEFIQTDAERKVDIPAAREYVKQYRRENRAADLFVAPLALCKDAYEETDFMNEKRNDYYAAVLATAFNADEMVLWREIDNLYTNRNGVREAHSLTYDETDSLVNSGVDLLHSDCIALAAGSGLTLRIMDVRDKNRERLYISSKDTQEGIKAIFTQDAVSLVRFQPLDTLPGYTLLSKLWETVGRHKIRVISMVSSNTSVSMLLSADRNALCNLRRELSKYVKINVDENLSAVHIIGSLHHERGTTKCDLMQTIKTIPVSLISYGSNDRCFTLAIRNADKNRLIGLLSKRYFENKSLPEILQTVMISG